LKDKEAKDHEKTLFDFDEDVNDLNAVAERYPVVTEIEKSLPAATEPDLPLNKFKS
jgi:hypothetical protein